MEDNGYLRNFGVMVKPYDELSQVDRLCSTGSRCGRRSIASQVKSLTTRIGIVDKVEMELQYIGKKLRVMVHLNVNEL